MVFYKGALSFETLQSMPLDKVIELHEHSRKILEEAKNSGV